jgi:methionyl-tRNA synthetase
MSDQVYLTTAIPYVNAAPHLGHALEFVQADVLARSHRLRGRRVRLLSGTDDHAFKNVTAAARAGEDVTSFVSRNAAAFADLQTQLDISTDDFLRTSTDPRHRPGVQRLWHQTADRGDFYRRSYSGLYCPGCEQFYDPGDLVNGRCPEHGTSLEVVTEENWFFRLSRYADQIAALLQDQRVRVEPEERRNEVLAWVRGGLQDISVSRPAARAQGWGIPVPGDESQVVYVWWDALCNYVTALDYGGDQVLYRDWWVGSAARVHVVGKGITRFHAVYWLALLLSTGQPLPTAVFVHDYLTVEGQKIAKSSGRAQHPAPLLERYGSDALRWWLASDVARVGDTDFTEERLLRRYHQDLAGGVGNLVHRSCALVTRFRGGQVPLGEPGPADAPTAGALTAGVAALPAGIDDALDRFDLRTACSRALAVVAAANRLIEDERPWELARRESEDGRRDPRLDAGLAALVSACRVLSREISVFVPRGAARLQQQLGDGSSVSAGRPVFPRIDPSAIGGPVV